MFVKNVQKCKCTIKILNLVYQRNPFGTGSLYKLYLANAGTFVCLFGIFLTEKKKMYVFTPSGDAPISATRIFTNPAQNCVISHDERWWEEQLQR